MTYDNEGFAKFKQGREATLKGVPSVKWYGEEWVRFDDATGVVAKIKPETSIDVTQESIRKACARGDFRSIRYNTGDLVQSCEWDKEIDVANIGVSKDDVEDWIAQKEYLEKLTEELAKLQAEQEESLPRADYALPWHEEDWISFRWAASQIKRRHDLSLGAAQRTLRELCADGDVRSIRYQVSGIDFPEDVNLIRPSEWLKDQIDFEADDDDDFINNDEFTGRFIDVSEDDLQHWLDEQAKVAGRPKEKLSARVLAGYAEQGATTPAAMADRGKRASRKLELVRAAIGEIWPQGIPQTLPSPGIEKEIEAWITEHSKKNNLRKLDIGRDTILRAAGRRR
jgi:hypothetical protein